MLNLFGHKHIIIYIYKVIELAIRFGSIGIIQSIGTFSIVIFNLIYVSCNTGNVFKVESEKIMSSKFNQELLVTVLAFLAILPCALAENTVINKRDRMIDQRLNCFALHASEVGVDWDDVCSTSSSPKAEQSPEIADAESLDQMIQKLQAVADEMLSNSVNGEASESAKTVDEVYENHNESLDTKRSVDDFIKEQGITNEFSSQGDTNFDNGDAVLTNPSGEDISEQEKSDFKKSHTTDVPDLWDEPDLMNDKAKAVSNIEYNKNALTMDYERYYYEYKEDSVGVKLKGWWSGVSGAYTYRPSEGDPLYWDWMNYYRLEGRYASAKLDYTSGGTGSDDGQPNYMYEVRSVIGRDFYPVSRVVVTPYGGFGFRYLVDDMGGRQTTTGQFGYDRKSHYYYLPLGLNYTYQVNNDWRIVGNGEYDIFLSGWQKSYLSDVPFPGYFDVRNEQKHGYGVRGSIKFIRILPFVNLSIEPFVRFWHIEDSDVVNAGLFDGLEPENTTIEGGLKAGVEF